MSSILKALKKLEQDKAYYSPESLKIDAEILKGADSSRKTTPIFAAALLMLFFGGGASVAYYLLRTPRPEPTTAVLQNAAVVSAKPEPVQQRVEPPVQPVVKAEKLLIKKQKVITQPQKNKPGTEVTTLVSKPEKSPAGAAGADKVKEAGSTTKKEYQPITRHSSLRVYGIAFNKNSEESLAIINGSPVSKGTVIEGASVVEIKNDRVMFQRNGEKFEVMLGQSQ